MELGRRYVPRNVTVARRLNATNKGDFRVVFLLSSFVGHPVTDEKLPIEDRESSPTSNSDIFSGKL